MNERPQVTVVDATSLKLLEAQLNQVLSSIAADDLISIQFLGRDGGRLMAMVVWRDRV